MITKRKTSLNLTLKFMVESTSFIISGFLIALRVKIGWALFVFAFFMAYVTGKQIEKEVIERYAKQSED